ncbi:unnamed protein product [Schistosoma mattheei]|uniref:Uncharacterized protein n=1 Tax=Schistosoma mattheei TaxID=31246 RepID=A0A183PI97_9TREM|nr:unnamed protein product [Schistosoma mattheei]
MVVEGSQQKTLDLVFMLFDTHQKGVSVILRELMLPDIFDSVSSNFTVRDVTTELSRQRLTSHQGTPVPSRLQVNLADEC